MIPASPQLVHVLLAAALLPGASPNSPAWLLPLAATALRSSFPVPDEALWLRARFSCLLMLHLFCWLPHCHV